MQKIRQVIKDPENQAIPLVYSVLPDTGDGIRLRRGWRNSGDPRVCQRGDFYQERAPHYTPTATVPYGSPSTSERGGYNSLGAEVTSHGPAGIFSYRSCHVWGRRVRPGVTQENLLEPWYMSAPSPASAQVTTTWSKSLNKIA